MFRTYAVGSAVRSRSDNLVPVLWFGTTRMERGGWNEADGTRRMKRFGRALFCRPEGATENSQGWSEAQPLETSIMNIVAPTGRPSCGRSPRWGYDVFQSFSRGSVASLRHPWLFSVAPLGPKSGGSLIRVPHRDRNSVSPTPAPLIPDRTHAVGSAGSSQSDNLVPNLWFGMDRRQTLVGVPRPLQRLVFANQRLANAASRTGGSGRERYSIAKVQMLIEGLCWELAFRLRTHPSELTPRNSRLIFKIES
jgi:hypothetical protein